METFANGMRAMKGEALARDSFSIMQRVRRINDRISRLNARLVGYKQQVDKLRTDSAIVRKELGVMLHEVHDFLNLANGCVSLRGISRTGQQLEAALEATYHRARQDVA
uniref:Uncharacterized protein n=1 Tax=Pyrodinium bahamense TaxID=73915 RepID=A0A7S0FSZ6_9DINO